MSALSLTRSQQSSRGNNRCTDRSIHEVPTRNFAARTTPSRPLIRSVTTPILHLPRFLSSDLISKSSPILGWRSSECFSVCRSLSDFTYSPSLRGRRLKGKGKGVFGARGTRKPGRARRERRKLAFPSFPPSSRAPVLAFLSRQKLPFPSLSNAYHAG